MKLQIFLLTILIVGALAVSPSQNCSEKLAEIMSKPRPLVSYIPQCSDSGNYKPQQCWVNTGLCWCVNTLTGERIGKMSRPKDGEDLGC